LQRIRSRNFFAPVWLAFQAFRSARRFHFHGYTGAKGAGARRRFGTLILLRRIVGQFRVRAGAVRPAFRLPGVAGADTHHVYGALALACALADTGRLRLRGRPGRVRRAAATTRRIPPGGRLGNKKIAPDLPRCVLIGGGR